MKIALSQNNIKLNWMLLYVPFCSFNALNIFYPHFYVRVCVFGCICVTVFHISDRTNETVFFLIQKLFFFNVKIQ